MYHDHNTKMPPTDPVKKVKGLFWPSLTLAPWPALALPRAHQSFFLLEVVPW